MAQGQRNKVFEGTFYFAQVFKTNYDEGGEFTNKDGEEIEIPPRYKVLFEFNENHIEEGKDGKVILRDTEGEVVEYKLREPTKLVVNKDKENEESWDIGYHCEFTSNVEYPDGEMRNPPRITDDFGKDWPGSANRADELPLYIGNGSKGKVSIYEHLWGRKKNKVKPILNRIVVTDLVKFEGAPRLESGTGFSLDSVEDNSKKSGPKEENLADPEEFFEGNEE